MLKSYQGSQLNKSFFHQADQFIQDMNIRNGKLYHSKQGTGTRSVDHDGGPMPKCGGGACTHLFPLVLVEDDRCEEEDGVAEKPQEASLQDTMKSAHMSISPAAGRQWHGACDHAGCSLLWRSRGRSPS